MRPSEARRSLSGAIEGHLFRGTSRRATRAEIPMSFTFRDLVTTLACVGLTCSSCARLAPETRAAACYRLSTVMDSISLVRFDSLFGADPGSTSWIDTLKLDTIRVDTPKGRSIPQYYGALHSGRTLSATWARDGDSLSLGWKDERSQWHIAAVIRGDRFHGGYSWRSNDLGTFNGTVTGSLMACPSF
jgi:hypothetical protein